MKFYGKIGFVNTIEEDPVNHPGVFTERTVVRPYYGDISRANKRWSTGSSINDNIEFDNELSVLVDPFAINEFHSIRFVEWMGAKWKVSNVSLQFPRMTLSLGGVYNG